MAITLPDVGTTASVAFGATDGPKTLTVTAVFAAAEEGEAEAEQEGEDSGGGGGGGVAAAAAAAGFADGAGFDLAAVPLNSWNATLFPRWAAASLEPPVKVSTKALLPSCGFSNCQPVADSDDPAAQPPAVYLTSTMTGALVAAARAGSVVVLLQQSSAGSFKTAKTRFKQAWWLGSAADNNAGTLVYRGKPAAAAVLGGMAPDGARGPGRCPPGHLRCCCLLRAGTAFLGRVCPCSVHRDAFPGSGLLLFFADRGCVPGAVPLSLCLLCSAL